MLEAGSWAAIAPVSHCAAIAMGLRGGATGVCKLYGSERESGRKKISDSRRPDLRLKQPMTLPYGDV